MTEDKALSETAKALGVGSLLPAIYGDLVSPAAKELGEGLATIAKAVKISLAPVEATVWGMKGSESGSPSALRVFWRKGEPARSDPLASR